VKIPPIFKGKQKSRKNREDTPDFKVYFKINIFFRDFGMFSIGPLEHKNEYGFRQENSPFKKKLKIRENLFLLIFTHIMC
jgi:hypothetical protein